MLNEYLSANAPLEDSARVSVLMQRVLETNALHHWSATTPLPSDFLASSRQPRILLIDERVRSEVDLDTPTRLRRQYFRAMLDAVRSTHPDANCWLLQSGDPGAGAWLSSQPGSPLTKVRRVPAGCSLHQVLRQVDRVYIVGASEGMAALLADIPVHVFGSPYYAGWGLTHDQLSLPNRVARPSLASLFKAAFLDAARYLDPTSHGPGTIEAVLDTVVLQHETAVRFADLTPLAGIRFQWWKRPFATPFLVVGGGRLRWVKKPDDLQQGECAVLWGARSAEGIPANSRRVRIEDGFLHSTGLGSDMTAPCSQVIDRCSLYFDPSEPSDLNRLLNQCTFTAEELTRAAGLRAAIVRHGLTKYNLGRRAPAWCAPHGRQVVLVTGQVADDASIRLGTRGIVTAEALLADVRARRPNAFIVYKPHPDVLSGNRNGLIDAARLADAVDMEADLISLIDVVDEVHTLSSLAGFDALLREKAVFTYGLPFYAGWGLTHDRLEQPFRERRLTLDMLTAGVLLRYPIYWDWFLSLYTTPEAIVEQMAARAARPLESIRGDRLRFIRKAFRWSRNAFMHAAWIMQNRSSDRNR
ncbi:capsular biosynthesis protein [Paraburkholderia sp. A3BS-1L]|uniref:capsular polysaccharide biosynthesis protein n=1 Tax=Paraburkholderia sp. A3BS-1L TaxID=3028375 RepID=UPI003DAA0BAB